MYICDKKNVTHPAPFYKQPITCVVTANQQHKDSSFSQHMAKFNASLAGSRLSQGISSCFSFMTNNIELC